MKPAIIIVSILSMGYSIDTNAQVPSCPLIDQDNFTTPAPWTSVDPEAGNGSIQVTTGALTFSNTEVVAANTCPTNHGACNGREIRLWRPLSQPLSNTAWRAEFKFRISDGNGASHTLIGFTAGKNEPQGSYNCTGWSCGSGNGCPTFTAATQDGIFASIIAFGDNQKPNTYSDRPFTPINQTYDATHPLSANNPPNLGWRIFGHAKNGAGPFYQAPIIAASNTTLPALDTSRGISLPALNTDYYLRLERLSNTACMIAVYTDAAMQNHVPGSPQCFTIEADIQGLNTVQNFTHQSGSFFRSTAGTVDDLKVFNHGHCQHPFVSCGASPTPTPTAGRSPTPTPTPRLSPTPTPTPKPTPSPTSTPKPTPSPTSTPTPTPSITPDPCCPPWNTTVMSDMLVPVFQGGINAPYTIHFVPTAAFNSQMQVYINYLYSMNSLMTKITIEWKLIDQGTGVDCKTCTPPYGPQIGPSVWTQWTQGGNGTPVFTNPGFFTGFPMVKGHCYMIHTGIYLEGGQHFFPDTCSVVDVCFQWQVSPKSTEPPFLEISAGKKVIKRIPMAKANTQ